METTSPDEKCPEETDPEETVVRVTDESLDSPSSMMTSSFSNSPNEPSSETTVTDKSSGYDLSSIEKRRELRSKKHGLILAAKGVVKDKLIQENVKQGVYTISELNKVKEALTTKSQEEVNLDLNNAIDVEYEGWKKERNEEKEAIQRIKERKEKEKKREQQEKDKRVIQKKGMASMKNKKSKNRNGKGKDKPPKRKNPIGKNKLNMIIAKKKMSQKLLPS